MHTIYGSICESKCESGFDWSTFPLAAVIFDCLWPKGLIVNITFSLPDHMAVLHLNKKNLQMPGAASGRGLVMIRVSIKYLHVAVLIRGREFDKGRDKQLLKRLYNTYSYIILTRPPKVIVI